MKRITVSALILIVSCAALGTAQQRGGAPLPTPTGPAAELIPAAVDAYNKQDVACYDKMLAADVVWLDEDGHTFVGKDRAMRGTLRGQLTATPPLKLTITNLTTGSSGDIAWGTFTYTIEGPPMPRKGLNSMIFKKVGSDWQIVLVHGAMNVSPTH